MSSTNFNGQDQVYYGTLGSGSNQHTLPIQTLPRSKKGPKWQKAVMDTLENIGLEQLQRNAVFEDYRKMRNGGVVYQDFDETQSELRSIGNFRYKNELPTYIKHYDLLGMIVRLLVGEYNKQKASLRITSEDYFSQNEFFNEKNKEVTKFVEDFIDLTIREGLIEKGEDPDKQDFKSEEERQQYLQRLQQLKDKIIPPDQIEEDLRKNFKTTIVEWAEKTMEHNYIRFNLDLLDMEDFQNYLSVGRYFRHYHVGYDTYYPEEWDVEKVFISEELSVKYPQKGEYAGKIDWYSGSEIISKFGHMIPKNIQDKLYGNTVFGDDAISSNKGPLQWLKSGGSELRITPYRGYYERQTAMSMQNFTGLPWGNMYTRNGENGELEKSPHYIINQQNQGYYYQDREFREDIKTRTDLIQVTEAYFKSKKLIGLLVIENPLMDLPIVEIVEEDVLPEMLKYYNIKKQSSKTLKEVSENPEEHLNTITWGYVDETWKGFKLNASNTRLKEHYYFGVEPLPYQIKDHENAFVTELPVAGILSTGIGKLIRPYQIMHNVAMNQNQQFMEKTIGQFFLMDFQLLTSEYDDDNNLLEKAEEWRETIRELGFNNINMSEQNLRGRDPSKMGAQMFDLSYNSNIQMNLQLAESYKRMAFEQIGITDQRRGAPNQYATAQGLEMGQEAQYAQTELYYSRFNTAKAKEKQIELSIAQWCATNNKDLVVNFTDSHNERIIRNFTDEDFSLRQIGVYPTTDAQQRRELEQFKQTVLQRNTMDSTEEDLAKIITSDSFVTILKVTNGINQERQKRLAEEREYKSKMEDKRIQGELQKQEMIESREDARAKLKADTDIKEAEIRAYASLADSNLEERSLQNLKDQLKEDRAHELKERELDIKEKKVDNDNKKNNTLLNQAVSDADMKFLELKEKAKDRSLQRQRMMSANQRQASDERIARD